MVQNPDLGVVLCGIGSGTSVTFKAADGSTGVPRLVTSGAWRRSDTFYPGTKGITALSVQGTISSASFGVIVGVERQRRDAPNVAAGSWPWSPVSTIRTDVQITSGGVSGALTSVTAAPLQFQTIKRTDLIGQTVDTSTGALISGGIPESLAVTLVTPDLFLAGAGASVIVRACSGFGALLSGDIIFVAADVG